MIEESMSPCFRGCGAFVPTNGAAICSACAVGPAAPDPALRVTWTRVGQFRVHTKGYSIRIEVLHADHHLIAGEARALAAAIVKAAEFVEALDSPYTNKPNPAGDPP